MTEVDALLTLGGDSDRGDGKIKGSILKAAEQPVEVALLTSTRSDGGPGPRSTGPVARASANANTLTITAPALHFSQPLP